VYRNNAWTFTQKEGFVLLFFEAEKAPDCVDVTAKSVLPMEEFYEKNDYGTLNPVHRGVLIYGL
jgi:hypothetical protein